jgi:hypothetical protein
MRPPAGAQPFPLLFFQRSLPVARDPSSPRSGGRSSLSQGTLSRPVAVYRRRQTRRARMRIPDCGLSIKLVVARQQYSDGGIPKREAISSHSLKIAIESCCSNHADTGHVPITSCS